MGRLFGGNRVVCVTVCDFDAVWVYASVLDVDHSISRCCVVEIARWR